jgi:hypothetical protein
MAILYFDPVLSVYEEDDISKNEAYIENEKERGVGHSLACIKAFPQLLLRGFNRHFLVIFVEGRNQERHNDLLCLHRGSCLRLLEQMNTVTIES